jgi:hypothetical protein
MLQDQYLFYGLFNDALLTVFFIKCRIRNDVIFIKVCLESSKRNAPWSLSKYYLRTFLKYVRKYTTIFRIRQSRTRDINQVTSTS